MRLLVPTDAPAICRRLSGCSTAGELYALAAELACASCGFERGVVLSIEGKRLTATTTDVLAEVDSDRLRRQVLREPVRGVDRLADRLQLANAAIGVIAPDAEPLAVLVLDRRRDVVSADDQAEVDAFAAITAVALQVVVMRERAAELARQLRHITAFTDALTTELLTAPVSLERGAHLLDFPVRPAAQASPGSRERLREILTEREADIAELLIEGRSNRDIAERLFVSAETVKMHVAHILRKLDVNNRVEAATRLLNLITPAWVDNSPRSGIAVFAADGDSGRHG